MNRQQRRAYERQQEKHRQIKAELVKNGIGQKELRESYEKGYREGWHDATPGVVKTCYAAAALALRDVLGFGRKRIRRVLTRLDEHVRDTLTSVEAINAVYEQTGLRLDFDEPLDSRVKGVDE